jgi:hypothetical protein
MMKKKALTGAGENSENSFAIGDSVDNPTKVN